MRAVIATTLQEPLCPTSLGLKLAVIVIRLKSEKCRCEKHNFSALQSMNGAAPFAKPVILISLFIKNRIKHPKY